MTCLAVDLAGARAVVELHRVGAQAHRAAHVADLLLLRQQVDHRVRRLGVELGRVGAVHAGDVAGELGDRDLHAEADAEVGHAVLAREARRADLALDPAHAEAAGDEDAVAVGELALDLVVGEPLGVDPAHLDLAAVVGAARGRAPRSPTGRRPRAGCTCRRAPIRTGVAGAASTRSTSASQSDRSGGGGLDPKWSSIWSSTPSARK